MFEIKRIGKMRRQLGLTQKELASLAGVSQSLIAKIESGRIDPAYSKVIQIMGALEQEQKKGKKTAGEIMSRGLFSVAPSENLEGAIIKMKKHNISQLPVLDTGKCIGSISDGIVLDIYSEKRSSPKSLKISEIMGESFPVLPSNALVDAATDLLKHYPAILVEKEGILAGIITKADLFKAI